MGENYKLYNIPFLLDSDLKKATTISPVKPTSPSFQVNKVTNTSPLFQVNKVTNTMEFVHMNDTSDNINVNSISPKEGTVTHVAIINLDVFYRTEVAVDGLKTGRLVLDFEGACTKLV